MLRDFSCLEFLKQDLLVINPTHVTSFLSASEDHEGDDIPRDLDSQSTAERNGTSEFQPPETVNSKTVGEASSDSKHDSAHFIISLPDTFRFYDVPWPIHNNLTTASYLIHSCYTKLSFFLDNDIFIFSLAVRFGYFRGLSLVVCAINA